MKYCIKDSNKGCVGFTMALRGRGPLPQCDLKKYDEAVHLAGGSTESWSDSVISATLKLRPGSHFQKDKGCCCQGSGCSIDPSRDKPQGKKATVLLY